MHFEPFAPEQNGPHVHRVFGGGLLGSDTVNLPWRWRQQGPPKRLS